MANCVKVSTLGPNPIMVDDSIDFKDLVELIISNWSKHLEKVLPDKPDLIVLPEACDRPLNFPMKPRIEYYRYRDNKIRDFFAEVANNNNCYIAYSAVRNKPDGTFRNSTEIIDRNGKTAGIYSKNHLIPAEKDDGNILYGKDAPIIQCDFGTVGGVICFDLNFDQLRQQYVEAQPDLLIYSSMYHGGLMLPYWAYSCRSHIVSAIANTSLPSEILEPTGQTITSTTNYFSHAAATINLDCKLVHLDGNFEKLDAAKKKYGPGFSYKDPGKLASVLISSEMNDITIEDIIKEFEIEILDDYMSTVLKHRNIPGNIEP